MGIIDVLIVEDDPMVVEVNQGFVNAVPGFKVVGVARTGKEAVRLAARLKPALTLLDVYLPDMSGLAALQEIRRLGLPTDVMLVTAAQDAETIKNAFRYGAVDYIIKPFKFNRLRSALENFAFLYNRLNKKAQLEQDDIDRLARRRAVAATEETAEGMPKGLNEVTLKQVLLLLIKEEASLSAEEVAAALGLARVTARRYLEYLYQLGKVTVELQYGSVGYREVNVLSDSFVELQNRVIQRGLCTACGTCAGICIAGAIGWGYKDNEPLPELIGSCTGCGLCTIICPGEEVNIPLLEQFVFGRVREEKIPDLGVYRYARAGCAVDRDIRKHGASGGLVTALLIYALEKGLVDCALVAGYRPDQPWRTEAKLAVTRQQLLAAAQSKYACVPVSALLNRAYKEGYRRLAVVGLPCQIHGLRKMQYHGQPAYLSRAVVLTVGLFCASQFYFEGTYHLLVEHLKVEKLEDITSLNYRDGDWPGHLTVELKDGRKLLLDRHQYMYHHLMPAYKRDRCEMCVDWSAELADLSVGDYWRPRVREKRDLVGVSSCLVRTPAGEELLEGAEKSGYVETISLKADSLAAGIGYELKKHAAAFRLRQRRHFGWPVPNYYLEINSKPFPRELHLAPERGQQL